MTIISRPNVPFIPKEITVHLGAPDEPAENVTVPFPDYIKNVASGTVYPTWPQSAIWANNYAQITFALNRIYSNWYRNQGYDFDITSLKEFDQSYVPGRSIFKNISLAIDGMFTDYLVNSGQNVPAYTPTCDGINVKCDGLAEWEAVRLANQGSSLYEMLQYFFGSDIDIVTDIPVDANFNSYPLYSLKLGSFGNRVSILQHELNEIGKNYTTIPKISDPNGIFDTTTDAAVKAFQRIFDLTEDGVVGPATWYVIKYAYESVKGLEQETPIQFEDYLEAGDTNILVKSLQYYLRNLGCYYSDIPMIEITGNYGPETTAAVLSFQKKFNIPQTGIVDLTTWEKINEQYRSNIVNIPEGCVENNLNYPGYLLKKGMGDKNVLLMQTYLDKISDYYSMIPRVNINGIFDAQMEAAVKMIQEVFNVGEVTGLIGAPTWDKIAGLYNNLSL